MVANGQVLAKREIELAKLELQEVVRDKAIAIGLAVVGAVFGLFVLAFIGVTAAAALALVLAEWLAWLIVTVAYTLVVAIALFVAVRLLKRPVFPRTKSTVEQTRDWAKDQVQR
jgi:apolipoprotein N-acyltransferase